jgi:hypothetical protein
MATHTCSKCRTTFKITEATRSQDRLFKNRAWSSSVSERIDQYFVVTCPHCGNQEVASSIRMFGLFGPGTAKVGLLGALLAIILVIAVLDHYGI